MERNEKNEEGDKTSAENYKEIKQGTYNGASLPANHSSVERGHHA